MILQIVAIILLLATPCAAEVAVKSGTVTKANMRLSTVAGTAFADFLGSGSVTLADYVGYKIKVCSVTDPTQCSIGYVKSASAGEELGPELVTGGNFETNLCAAGWTCGAGWAMDAGDNGKATFSNATGTGLVQSSASVTGTLYKIALDIDAVSGAGIFTQMGTPGSVATGAINSTGTKTFYLLAAANYSTQSIYGYNAATATIDNYSRKKVLAPSATGVTITTLPGGTTYNWSSNTFSTQINDTAGFTYAIYPTINQTITGSDNTFSYIEIDCANSAGMAGILNSGTGNAFSNITNVRCPGGSYQFDESATMKNSIGFSTGPDITIAAGKTVTGKNNIFSDAAKSGDGTYTDVGNHTQWGVNPADVFVDYSGGNFHLKPGSPAIKAGTRD